jgi:uncharacterized protein (DUF302 family)
MFRFIIVLFASALLAVQVFASDGLFSQKSKNSVDVTLDRLESIVTEKGLTVFARIDHSAGAKKAELELRPTKLLIFGNPKVGTLMMQSNQTAGIDLPMKALAWEDESGQVWLTCSSAKYLAGRHHIEDRETVVEKMTGALRNFASYAIQLQEIVP